MERYARHLSWNNAKNALVFHGQRSEVAEIFTLTSIFQIANVYRESRFAELKLMVGFVWAGVTKEAALYSEGHYLLTLKGEKRQSELLAARSLTPEQVWILDPLDPRVALLQ
jgi:hypothetical protein|tara:strand:+ start:1591 stop:1926 length:336 start_codon:yes stop_codon:yes gene_type:complete